MAQIEVGNLKSLWEALCVAQSAMRDSHPDTLSDYTKTYTSRLQEVIDQIEILRPLGRNGKHGRLHTEHCGCADNPYLDLLNEWRVIPMAPMYEISGRGMVRASEHSNPEERELTEPISRVAGDEVAYDLWRYDEGYLRYYSILVSTLLDDAFPELGEKAK